MKMKKLLSAALAAAMVLSLAACGKKDQPAQSGSQSASQSGTTSQEVDFSGVKIRVAAMNGPTGMGMARLADQVRNDMLPYECDVTFSGSPDDVRAGLLSGELDIAAVPVNMAAALYNKTGGEILTLAANTPGVLYIVEKGDTVQSMADLAGKKILAAGQGSTPEYVINYLLEKNGLTDSVEVEYVSEHAEAVTQMAAGGADLILVPEPFVTTALSKVEGARVALDLTQEWNKVCDTQLITGVTVVRTEYAKENPDIVANFLRDYEKSIKAAQTDIAGTAALCEETGVVAKKAIAQKALPQCNIVYRVGDEMKADVNAYLKVLYDASPAAVGGKLPDANFYYTKATPGQVFWRSVQRSFQ